MSSLRPHRSRSPKLGSVASTVKSQDVGRFLGDWALALRNGRGQGYMPADVEGSRLRLEFDGRLHATVFQPKTTVVLQASTGSWRTMNATWPDGSWSQLQVTHPSQLIEQHTLRNSQIIECVWVRIASDLVVEPLWPAQKVLPVEFPSGSRRVPSGSRGFPSCSRRVPLGFP